jgi:DinB superfamily
MTDTEHELLTLEPIADVPEIGRWLSAMEDGRRDTLRELEGVTREMVDWRPDAPLNSIGTLLYHIGLVEADWLLVDIQGRDYPTWLRDVLPYPDRDDRDHLTHVEGQPLQEHLDRLATIRAHLLEELRPMSAEDFHAPRVRERYDVSPAWVLHHLLQHEAEHRSHIAWLRDTYRAKSDQTRL